MKFSETITIKNKIFKKQDFLKLWECVSSNITGEFAGEATIRIENDGREVTAQGVEVFETSNFKSQKIKSIHIDYRSTNWDAKVNILIENTRSILFNWCKIAIEGTHEDWVLACHAKLTGVLDEVENTSMLSRFYMRFGRWVAFLVYGILFWTVFNAIILPIKAFTDNSAIRFALLISYFGIGGCGVWSLNKVEDLFYVVEIDVNGARSRFRYKILSALWALLSAIIIPVFVSWYFGVKATIGGTSRSHVHGQSAQYGEGAN